MSQPDKKPLLLAIVGIPLMVVLAGAVWVSVKIVTRPGPRQIEEAWEQTRREAMGVDVQKLEERQKQNEEIKKKLAELPEFVKPPDGIISPERMKAYAMMHQAMTQALQEEQKAVPKGKKSLMQGLQIAQRLMLITKGAQLDKMAEYGIGEKENNWISKNISLGELAALVKLEKLTEDPEQLELIRKHENYLAIVCEYYEPDEKGAFLPKLDDFDPDSVPRQHYLYALQYYKELSFPQVQLDKHDWTPLLKKEGITVD